MFCCNSVSGNFDKEAKTGHFRTGCCFSIHRQSHSVKASISLGLWNAKCSKLLNLLGWALTLPGGLLTLGGLDGLKAEHFKYGGKHLKLWLKKIFNRIIALEDTPQCMKDGLVIPVYKW